MSGLFRMAGWFFNCTDGILEHHHGPIGDPDLKPYENGELLWFELDDFDSALARAEKLNAQVIKPRHRNPPSGGGGPNHWECWLRDPDGYTVVLASPDGTAGYCSAKSRSHALISCTDNLF